MTRRNRKRIDAFVRQLDRGVLILKKIKADPDEMRIVGEIIRITNELIEQIDKTYERE